MNFIIIVTICFLLVFEGFDHMILFELFKIKFERKRKNSDCISIVSGLSTCC